MGTDAQVRRHSITLLCVWVFINPVSHAAEGTPFVNPVEGSIHVSLLSERNLEFSQLCSGPAYTYLVSSVICMN
jgi:hypothetical protein